MMKNNLVSVITPAHNSENYIGHMIESVLNQTYQDLELIIVDDCSTDNTLEIAKSYANKDSRITIIHLDENQGVVAARNIAIEKAKGRYLAFLDSDDLWKRCKLEEQITFMVANNYAFSFSSYELIDEYNVVKDKIIKAPKIMNYRKALKNTAIGCLTVCIDVSIVGKVAMPNLKHAEDHATWISILKQGYNAYSIDKPLAFYRVSTAYFLSPLSQLSFRAYFAPIFITVITLIMVIKVFDIILTSLQSSE